MAVKDEASYCATQKTAGMPNIKLVAGSLDSEHNLGRHVTWLKVLLHKRGKCHVSTNPSRLWRYVLVCGVRPVFIFFTWSSALWRTSQLCYVATRTLYYAKKNVRVQGSTGSWEGG